MASAAAVIFFKLRARARRRASATGLVEDAGVCAWPSARTGAKARARSEQATRFMEALLKVARNRLRRAGRSGKRQPGWRRLTLRTFPVCFRGGKARGPL